MAYLIGKYRTVMKISRTVMEMSFMDIFVAGTAEKNKIG